MNVLGNVVELEGIMDLDDLEQFEDVVDLPLLPLVRHPA
jgi:hypothetical protein